MFEFESEHPVYARMISKCSRLHFCLYLCVFFKVKTFVCVFTITPEKKTYWVNCEHTRRGNCKHLQLSQLRPFDHNRLPFYLECQETTRGRDLALLTLKGIWKEQCLMLRIKIKHSGKLKNFMVYPKQ
jgi:hypothetical protein